MRGVRPDGRDWDYMLVPILDAAGDAIGLVQLDAADGAFEQVFMPDEPIPYAGLSQDEAAQEAAGWLVPGERLSGGALTWDPWAGASSLPMLPYYQFDLIGRDGHLAGEVRVSLVTGASSRNGGNR